MAAATDDGAWVRHGGLAYRVVAEVPVLRVERAGWPDEAALMAHCLGIVEEAVRRRARLLLVDERGMDGFLEGGLGSMLLYREITREGQARGLADHMFRAAILSPPLGGSDRGVFAQSVTGVGVEMAYFEVEGDALAWLGVRD